VADPQMVVVLADQDGKILAANGCFLKRPPAALEEFQTALVVRPKENSVDVPDAVIRSSYSLVNGALVKN